MANLYGVANPLGAPTLVIALIGAADVSCPSATETNVLAFTTVQAGRPGNTFGLVYVSIGIVLTTAPTAMTIGARIAAAADFDSFAVPVGLLALNAVLLITTVFYVPNSVTTFQGAGSTINITVNPTGQTVTAKNVGSRGVLALFQGPDT